MTPTELTTYFRPFDQTDYFNAKQAYANMVALKIITPAEMRRLLRSLKAAVRE